MSCVCAVLYWAARYCCNVSCVSCLLYTKCCYSVLLLLRVHPAGICRRLLLARQSWTAVMIKLTLGTNVRLYYDTRSSSRIKVIFSALNSGSRAEQVVDVNQVCSVCVMNVMNVMKYGSFKGEAMIYTVYYASLVSSTVRVALYDSSTSTKKFLKQAEVK